VKSLFWTGAVLGSERHGQSALWRWWNYYRQHRAALQITHFAAFNDGSSNLPVEWFVKAQNADQRFEPLMENRLNLIFHREHLGRRDIHCAPGFWRNLLTAVRLCQEQEFERFIICEYDCFLVSPEMLYEVGSTNSGLVCYWCPTYDMPETAIVICSKDRFTRTGEQAQAVFQKQTWGAADRFEVAMDWTEIRKGRKGDRYGETYRPIPADADYVCQLGTHANMLPGGGIEALP
jgi:hypothetical protein